MSLAKSQANTLTTNTSLELSGKLRKKLFELKEDNRKPLYHYVTGMLSGIIVSKIAIIEGLQDGEEDKASRKMIMKFGEDVIDACCMLIKDYHWKRKNVMELYKEFFKI